MNEWVLVGGMAILTFAIRYGVLALSGWVNLPLALTRMLCYVPPAVLTAIAVPAVLMPTGNEIQASITNPRLVGAIVALLVGWRSQNLLLTIGLGMLAFIGWQWLLFATMQ